MSNVFSVQKLGEYPNTFCDLVIAELLLFGIHPGSFHPKVEVHCQLYNRHASVFFQAVRTDCLNRKADVPMTIIQACINNFVLKAMEEECSFAKGLAEIAE